MNRGTEIPQVRIERFWQCPECEEMNPYNFEYEVTCPHCKTDCEVMAS